MTGADRERVIEQVIADYLAAEDVGKAPDRAAILAAHPDLAPELQSFFREHDRFDRLAAPLRADPAPTVDLASANSAPVGGDGLSAGRQIRYFGDYEILEELGRGGMGVVYRARQVSLNRSVALKMIRSGILADADDLRRFQNEVEAVALLDHPGVVPVYEVGEIEGQRYFSMKLIEGGGLSSRLDAYKDDPRAATRLVAEAAEAVAHAHARGVLHRDLKPANLLIDADGRPFITDFGLAKRMAEDLELTQSGAILGTPAHMSPEQAAGRRGTITTATDVYGLGAVLYSLLTGRSPFNCQSIVETLEAARSSTPEGPRRLNPKIPRDLETICLKCLEKDPRRRYPTAQALADDLRAWLDSRPIAARPVGMIERAVLFARRKPAVAVAYGLAAAVVFLIGFGGSIARLWRAAERSRAEAEAARAGLAAVEYGRTIEAAHQAWRDDNVAATLALLDATGPELRGWEWRYVSALCHSELMAFEGPKTVFEPYFDEEGMQLATLDSRGKIRFWDAVTGAELSGNEGRTFHELVALSRDGTRIVLSGRDGLSAIIRDRQDGKVLVTLKGHRNPVISAAFDPEGTRVVTGSMDGTAKIWDARSGKELVTLGRVNSSAIYHALFSPDGMKVATAGEDRTARLWDARSGDELLTFRGHERGLNRVEFSRDGAQIVTASDDKTARVWDAATGAHRLTLKGHTRRVTSAAFSRNGSRIVTSSEDRTARIFAATNGAAILTLLGHTAPVWSARFSADGSKVITAVAGGKYEPARIWDSETGPGPFQLEEGRDSVKALFSPDGSKVATMPLGRRSLKPAIFDARTGRLQRFLETSPGSSIDFSRDGSRIVTAGLDGTARIWDSDSGRELLTLQGHKGFLTAVSFSPNASMVVTAGIDGIARLWDSRAGTMLKELSVRGGRVNSAAFNQDGSRVVTSGGDGAARIWDVATGSEVRTLTAHSIGIYAASYSPDGLRIATGGNDNTAKVWDASSGANLLTLRGHTGPVRSAAFSPDGSRIVTASDDGMMRLWDAHSGTEVLALKGHTDSVPTAYFSPDGTRIVTGSDDGTVRIWDARLFSIIRAERANAPTTPRPTQPR